MGWDAEEIAAPVPRPVLPGMLHGLWLHYGEDEHRASASTRSSAACGVVRFRTTVQRGTGRRRAGVGRRSASLEDEGDSTMADGLNWQLGRDDGLSPTRKASRMAVRLRLQHQPLHRLPDLHDGLQEHLDLLQGPGIHVVEQRRVEALRRLSADTGTRSCWPCSRPPTRAGRSWNAATADGGSKPYGTFEGKTIFEAAPTHVGPDGPQVALGYLPTDDEWRHPNIHEDTATGGRWNEAASSAARRSCPSTASGSFTWRGSATTARIPGAWPPARARRSTSGPKTASC